jgi:aminoglycoside phosphotransferase (APT) family kinase protein
MRAAPSSTPGEAPGPAEPWLERVLWALECPTCGERLEARGRALRCPSGHVGYALGGVRTGHASDLFELRDERTGRALALKIPKVGGRIETDERLRQETLNESTTLARLWKLLGPGPYRVPEAMPGAVRGRAILMRTLAGADLEHALYGSAAWRRPLELGRGFERAGEWLGNLVAATEVERSPFHPDGLLERTRLFLAEIAEAGHPRSRVEGLTRLVESAAARASGEETPRCLVHGDFRPRHVFLAPDDVTVIDFEQAATGWAHEDAGFFLAAVDGFSARHPARRWSPGGRLAAGRFLRAYLRRASIEWGEAGRAWRLAAMVRALNIEYRGRLPSARPAVFRRMVLPHYERWFRAWERRPF